MPSDSLFKLWKLHEIDTALVEMQKKAAALDPGRQAKAELDSLQKQWDDLGEPAKKLQSEMQDLELANQGIDAKIKKFDTEMYSGKVSNSREVENIQKEIELLKKQRASNEERLLELYELAPPAKKIADEIEAKMAAAKKTIVEKKKSALADKATLETEFKKIAATRPVAAKAVEAALLARYDAIRQKHSGIAMSRVVKNGYCGACGTQLPLKTVETAKEERLVSCESCHRILYYSESIL